MPDGAPARLAAVRKMQGSQQHLMQAWRVCRRSVPSAAPAQAAQEAQHSLRGQWCMWLVHGSPASLARHKRWQSEGRCGQTAENTGVAPCAQATIRLPRTAARGYLQPCYRSRCSSCAAVGERWSARWGHLHCRSSAPPQHRQVGLTGMQHLASGCHIPESHP